MPRERIWYGEPSVVYHLISGWSSEEAQTLCGRGFNVAVPAFAVREYGDLPDGLRLCLGCERGAYHDKNAPGPPGGIPVSSARLGTGARHY